MGRKMTMTSARLSQAVDFIKTRQNPDGGWGYGQGRMSLAEPTGLCVLALHQAGDRARAARGLEFLRSCQKESGGVGAYPQAAEGSWMAYAALLAFHVLAPGGPEERRLSDWILGFEDASGLFSQDDLAAVAARYGYDASIAGWSWSPRTTAWVEPTALIVLALIQSGHPPGAERVKDGLDLILDRKVASGGWNYGNPRSGPHRLEASTMSTALALAALGAAGVPESHPAVSAGLRVLGEWLAGDISTASLAWTVLALRAYPGLSPRAPAATVRLAALQRDDGGFHDNLFETALAFLVLSEAPILKPAPGRRG
jgi:hypothetical protein